MDFVEASCRIEERSDGFDIFGAARELRLSRVLRNAD
jgi:hypothetical protein